MAVLGPTEAAKALTPELLANLFKGGWHQAFHMDLAPQPSSIIEHGIEQAADLNDAMPLVAEGVAPTPGVTRLGAADVFVEGFSTKVDDAGHEGVWVFGKLSPVARRWALIA